ncbi:MAG: hypothetical protein JEZ12_16425 [Desulfobacterium sp.]|nr:hypothetical protein [Desulfobacterium sp.]
MAMVNSRFLNRPPIHYKRLNSKSTIIVHSNNFSGAGPLDTFYKPVNHFCHGNGVMTGEIGLVMGHSIFNQPRGYHIDSEVIFKLQANGFDKTN